MESTADTHPAPADFGGAVDALTRAGVLFTIRKPPKGRELDLFVEAGSRRAAGEALAHLGFIEFPARGQRGHRFYLACRSGSWEKIDVKVTPRRTPPRTPERMVRVFAALAAQIPPTRRRAGLVIAILGPDGAGKGTIIDAIRAGMPVACHSYYLGARVPRGSNASRARRRAMRLELREPLFVMKKLLRSSRQLVRVYAVAWRGGIVLCDRHPLEALATRPRITPFAVRLERFLLRRVIPTPDLIVVLDAPTAVLLGRKHEHPAAVIERWRSGYRRAFPEGPVVRHSSTDRAVDDTVAEIQSTIWDTLRVRRGAD